MTVCGDCGREVGVQRIWNRGKNTDPSNSLRISVHGRVPRGPKCVNSRSVVAPVNVWATTPEAEGWLPKTWA